MSTLVDVELAVDGTHEQEAFWSNPARYRAFVGGIGSGKTWAGAIEALCQGPGLGAIIAPTYPMLRDATARTFRQLAEQAGLLVAWHQTEMRATLTTGCEVLMRSADEPDRLRGLNLGWAWLDEPAEMREQVWPIILGRLRLEPGRVWCTGTPKGFNWLYDRFKRRRTEDYATIHARTESNKFLPQAYLDSVREDYAGKWAQQELDGEFVELAGGVFERQWFRIVPAAPSGLRWVRYYDLAVSTKTTASRTATAACALGDDGTLYVRDAEVGRIEWPEQKRMIRRLMLAEPETQHGVESALHGIAAVQELQRDKDLAHVYLSGVGVHKDKLARARIWQARAASGKVALVEGPWVSDWLAEVCGFTGERDPYDDQVDAVSGCVQMLGLGGSAPVTQHADVPNIALHRGRFGRSRRP